jgi:hypothetical protein
MVLFKSNVQTFLVTSIDAINNACAKSAATFDWPIFYTFKPAPHKGEIKIVRHNGAMQNHFLPLFKRQNYAAAN